MSGFGKPIYVDQSANSKKEDTQLEKITVEVLQTDDASSKDFDDSKERVIDDNLIGDTINVFSDNKCPNDHEHETGMEKNSTNDDNTMSVIYVF